MFRSALAFAVLALTASPAFAIVDSTSVPEPATLALTGLGVVAAMLTLKRR